MVTKDTTKEKPPSWFSESLARGLMVIRAFDASAQRLRPTDVAKRTGLNRAAARRYMLTLQDLGYLGSEDDRFYLRPKVLDLGYAYISSMQIDRLVQPFLNDLAARTHESSSFAVLDNDEVLFVARSSGEKILQISVSIGGRVPAWSTSLGHALLSGLSEEDFERYLKSLKAQVGKLPISLRDLKASIEKARKQGWVLVSNVLTRGIVGIASPIRNADGSLLGAINVANYGAGNPKLVRDHVPLLLETAASLERTLQARGQTGNADRFSARAARLVTGRETAR
ncbi:IclR family transcriptional regulator domain-containing protein [Pseudorhodoplanes sp.]|uniref:IclR family transcriptional regulator domain-containing protein n=1 Tax=Pseudorhodoplanes sp. TaxID=1934341 RepID=UPI002BEA1E34|nr:IclR family transcriptional regulator C-terminal domain-containing protein [Pseudorhodoplanes sp.]HWV41650.1 IclR family transcriptional regulator C-terminal domain-containing protein [Pseudorhodoplanes sp.]